MSVGTVAARLPLCYRTESDVNIQANYRAALRPTAGVMAVPLSFHAAKLTVPLSQSWGEVAPDLTELLICSLTPPPTPLLCEG